MTVAAIYQRTWVRRASAVVVLLAVVVAGPVAFGIAMSGDDFPDSSNPLLVLVAVLLGLAVASKFGSVAYAYRAYRSSDDPKSARRSTRLAFCALMSGGLIVATFAVSVLPVVLFP